MKPKPSTMTTLSYIAPKIAVIALLVGGLLASVSNAGRNPNPGVVPINANAYGGSYGDWASAWWQWALGVPTEINPVLDPSGENCDAGQSGPVWFLAGTFGGPGDRVCSVPAGKALFFPLINSVWEATLCEEPNADPLLTFEELLASAEADTDTVTELFCIVDGVPLNDLFNYRAASPEEFYLFLEESNVVKDIFGCDDATAGVHGPAAASGYWIMLSPLTPGEHTIEFGGTAFDGTFQVDVKYQIIVE